jgi:hypothetical protein
VIYRREELRHVAFEHVRFLPASAGAPDEPLHSVGGGVRPLALSAGVAIVNEFLLVERFQHANDGVMYDAIGEDRGLYVSTLHFGDALERIERLRGPCAIEETLPDFAKICFEVAVEAHHIRSRLFAFSGSDVCADQIFP